MQIKQNSWRQYLVLTHQTFINILPLSVFFTKKEKNYFISLYEYKQAYFVFFFYIYFRFLYLDIVCSDSS